jgi:hypothetical protein
MAGELFDSYGRPVIIPVAFDDSSGLSDNYGRPLVVVNAIPLSGGTLTGDLNIGANKIVTSTCAIKEVGASLLGIRDSADTTYRNLRAGTFYSSTFSIYSGGYITTESSDNAICDMRARDNGVGMVTIGSLISAADPYFRIGRDDSGVALNAVTDMLVFQVGGGGGNAAAGIGVGIAFNLSNDAHEIEKRAFINAVVNIAANGTEKSRILFGTMTGGVLQTASYIQDGYFYNANGPLVTGSTDSGAVVDYIGIGGYDISAGHRALAISTEEVVVASAAGASDAYVPIRYNGVTYKLLLHT